MSLRDQIRKGSTELVLLTLLQERPMLRYRGRAESHEAQEQ